MENEKRLIDANKAQAVLVNMAEHLLEAGNPEMAGAVGYAAEVIGKQKTVDAVEVVYCKDCARCKKGYCTIRKDSWGATLQVGLHDFCSDAERRADNGKID